MPNNTDTYWDIDGQSLHTYARSIETLVAGPPEFRGEDHTIPLQPGQTWVPKTFDSNTITLAMWLRGVAQDAGAGVVQETKAQFQSNWNDLMRLIWRPGEQVTLRKRFYDGGALRSAVALVEFAGGLQPSMMGNSAARCTIDLKIAKGVFFAEDWSTVPLVNGNNTITVLGTAPTVRVKVTVNGARNTVKIRNTTAGVEFTYPRTIAVGENAVVDAENYSVIDSELNYDGAPLIVHSGAPQWLLLKPGANIINVSSTSGAGVVSLQYKAAWV